MTIVTKEEADVAAFLKLIRFAEHHTDSDDVYFLLYGGKQRFLDTGKHPNQRVKAWGKESTAAGAYQILYPTWYEAWKKGIVTDFSKASQDKLAIEKLRSRHALGYVQQGDIDHAIPLLRNEWTSLPGASQSKMTMDEARTLFAKYLGEVTGKP
jgi:muramidase (phage lysozyme)